MTIHYIVDSEHFESEEGPVKGSPLFLCSKQKRQNESWNSLPSSSGPSPLARDDNLFGSKRLTNGGGIRDQRGECTHSVFQIDSNGLLSYVLST